MSRALALLLPALLLAARAQARPLSVGDEGRDSRARAWSKGFKGSEAPRWRRRKDAELRKLSLSVAPDLEKGELSGTAVLSGAALAGGLKRLELDAVRLKIDSVRDGSGRDLEYELTDGRLAVELPKKLAAGAAFELRIAYSARPKMGLYFFKKDERYPGQPLQLWSQGEPEEARHWMPVYDYPNSRSAFELKVSVPEALTVVSNGALLSKKPGPKPGEATWTWSQERAFSPYLITLAVGDFAVVRSSAGAVPLAYYVPRDRAGDAERSFGRTPDMVAFYEKTVGEPYPWGAYAQTALYGFPGGMENVGATSLTDRCLLDEKARADGDWVEDLLSHELAHQWFGDLLTCKDWSHLWLNEGIASYFQALYREHWLGGDEFLYDMDKKAADYFSEAGDYERPVVSPSYAYADAMFDSHTYDKGAWVLHMLRQELGEEGFWAAFRLYVQRGRHGLVETEDLRRAVEDSSGRPLQDFFDQWLYRAGHPKLELKYHWDAGAKTARLTLKQKQERPFSFKLAVELRSTFKTRPEVLAVSKAEETFEFKLGSKPKSVRVDPEGRLLKELELSLPAEMLVYQLAKDPSVRVRQDALRALKALGGPEALEAAASCLASDPFWGLRADCARVLGELGGPEARDALIAALKQDAPKVRQAAAGALKAFILDAKAYEALAAAEGDPSWNVRSSVLASLGALKLEQARPLLEARLAEPSWNEKVRRGAFGGLGSLRSEASLPVLQDWSQPGRPVQARTAAIAAYAKTACDKHSREALDQLARILETETDEGVLSAGATALASLGEPKGGALLSRLAAREARESLRRRVEQARDDLREGKKDRVSELSQELDGVREDLEKLKKQLEEKK